MLRDERLPYHAVITMVRGSWVGSLCPKLHLLWEIILCLCLFPEKRSTLSGGFPGFQPTLLARRDSSLKLKQKPEDKICDPVLEESKETVNNGEARRLSLSPDADTMATEPSE